MKQVPYLPVTKPSIQSIQGITIQFLHKQIHTKEKTYDDAIV